MLTLEAVEIQQGDFRMSADFALKSGSITAVIGPSGAGKSTLLSVVAGFVEPVTGRVIVQDRDVTDIPAGKRPVTVVFQDSNLFPHLTVAQNAGLGLRPNLRLSPPEHLQVSEALKRVGLEGFANRKPAALSGGQQSRVALARMLLRDAPLVLLDEPFSALGPALKIEMLDLVREIAQERGLTVLMVTHDPEDAKRIAGQAVLVADGIAHEPVPTKKLFDNPPESLRTYLGT